MSKFTEAEISTEIVTSYHCKLLKALQSDVLVVGAGPSGLAASWTLSKQGFNVVILEKNLSPGGGIWGGSAGMNEVVIQPAALEIVKAMGVSYRKCKRLFVMDAMELASALCSKALQSGATMLNLMTAEDVCLHGQRVTGVVANRSLISGKLPVDPIVFTSRVVIDATGHEAVLANFLHRRQISETTVLIGEGAMNAEAGEKFVVKNIKEVFPGLWVTGMAVCATQGGPRMGPIFGGMLMSGVAVGRRISTILGK
jgi:sulfide-dependent adenosine diphosphate thiazole synthase